MSHLLRNPILITVLCFPVCALLLPLWSHRQTARWFFPGVLAVLAMGVAGPILSASGHMIYHDEPTVIAVAAASLHGQPLYLSPDSSDLYSLLYGPVTYWVYMPPMVAGIHDLRIFQLWVILPLLFAAVFMLRIARNAADHLGTAVSLFPYALMVLMQSPNEWAMKGDAWILLFFILELHVALTASPVMATLLVALCIALLVNLKITLAILACVPLALLAQRFHPKIVLITASLAAVFAGLPFLVPGVSAVNFLFWLRASSHHGIDLRLALSNLALVLFMALTPLSLFLIWMGQDRPQALAWLRSQRTVAACTFAASITAAVTGAKVGAGPWHCAPLAPLFVWLTAVLWSRLPGSIRAQGTAKAWIANLVLAQCLLAGRSFHSSVLLHLRGDTPAIPLSGELVARDLLSIVHAHPHTQIAMGYGDNASYETTWQRPLLVLLGNHYSLDADALNENEFAHLPLSNAVLGNFRDCAAPIMLIPAHTVPFSMRSLYFLAGAAAPPELFPAAFRDEFLRRYRKSSSSRYFDLWTCAP